MFQENITQLNRTYLRTLEVRFCTWFSTVCGWQRTLSEVALTGTMWTCPARRQTEICFFHMSDVRSFSKQFWDQRREHTGVCYANERTWRWGCNPIPAPAHSCGYYKHSPKEQDTNDNLKKKNHPIWHENHLIPIMFKAPLSPTSDLQSASHKPTVCSPMSPPWIKWYQHIHFDFITRTTKHHRIE